MPETAEQRIDQNLRTATPDVIPAAAASRKKETARVERVAKRFEVKDVDLFYGNLHAVQDVTMTIEANQVTSLIGSSGCGKTTMLRSLNRMHELTPGARVDGEISLDGQDIYSSNVDPVEVEALLLQHPAVSQVKVVGVPDARLQEVACACVVLRPGAQAPSTRRRVSGVGMSHSGWAGDRHPGIETEARRAKKPSGNGLARLTRQLWGGKDGLSNRSLSQFPDVRRRRRKGIRAWALRAEARPGKGL